MKKIQGNKNYYDINSDTLYYKKWGSKTYLHELSHAKDMSKKWYRNLNYLMDLYLEFYCFTFIFVVWFDVGIILFFLPYALFRVQEEIRAYYNAYKMEVKQFVKLFTK